MAKPVKIEVDIEREAATLASQEITAWEESLVFVTEKVAFHIRNLIRQCRKNYWGVFDEAVDPVTGRAKVWVPLTQFMTETVVKQTDLDTKDVNFRAKHPKAVGLTSLVRHIVRNWLDDNFFGESMDSLGRALAIDGTRVWKTSEEQGKMVREDVDLLNFYIDPSAKSIQETPRVYERILMLPSEFKKQKEWINKEGIEGQVNHHPTESRIWNAQPASQQKYVEVFDAYGIIPKSWISGKKKDKEKEIEGHMVFSRSGGAFRVHLIEENTAKDSQGGIIKPYEEAWLRKVSGRWHGMGVPEMLLMLQTWINLTVNVRVNRSVLSQMGIFKIRSNAGITPQMVGKLGSNGAIVLNDLNDLEQMVIQDIPASSYSDEENISNWAQKVTSAFEAATGERMPASTPATNAVLQNQAAQSSFILIKEGVGMFLQRWLKRHALQVISRNMEKEDIVRITGDVQELQDLDERIVLELVARSIEERGQRFDELVLQQEIQRAIEDLRKMGKDRYISLLEKIDFSQYDVQVYITNEEIDKGVLANNLVNVLKIAPEYRQAVIKQLFDLMGLDPNQLEKSVQEFAASQQQQQVPQAGVQAGGVQPMQTQNPTRLVKEANQAV